MARQRYVGLGKNIPANQTNLHKHAVPIQAREVIRVSDIILEVLDARFIGETRNKALEDEIIEKGKKIIYIINKADLVDVPELIKSGKLADLKPYVMLSCKKNIGRQRLRDMIKIEVKRIRKANKQSLKDDNLIVSGKAKEIIMKQEQRAQIGIIGYPNTGKSSLTNILTGRGGARASKEAGYTKGIQKIRFTKDILILDSPGVIRENENAEVDLRHLKKHGKIGARAFDKVKSPDLAVYEIMKQYPKKIESFYGVEADDSYEFLEKIGRKWGFLLSGNRADIDKTARKILKEWQLGMIK